MTIRHDWEQSGSERVFAASQVAETVAVNLPRLGFPTSTPRPVARPRKVGLGWAKRTFDIVFALVLLVPLSVFMAVVALVLLVAQGRPILYTAPRMKTTTETFPHMKFRTMLLADNDHGVTGAHKAWRITRIGAFLRRTRIDELPQLFNILRGDMSFVGPRPTIPEYIAKFPEEYGRALECRPGVTGLATLIYHRHEGKILDACHDAQETQDAYCRRCLPMKLRIERIYGENQSLMLDLWIMWRTVVMVMFPTIPPRPHRRRSRLAGRR